MKIKTKKSKLKTIGIELPFGWCLVKGNKLRELQSELREAKFKEAIKNDYEARSIWNSMRKDRINPATPGKTKVKK